MTFEEWSGPCEHKSKDDDKFCLGQHPIYVRVCSRNNCPRIDEFTADLEAAEYDTYLEDKLQREQEKRV